jgi:hypothetical protein
MWVRGCMAGESGDIGRRPPYRSLRSRGHTPRGGVGGFSTPTEGTRSFSGSSSSLRRSERGVGSAEAGA